MKNLIYPLSLKKDNGYVVSFPDFAGCITEGDTIDDAYKYAKEVLALHLDGMKDTPTPSTIGSIQLLQSQRCMPVEADKRDVIIYF